LPNNPENAKLDPHAMFAKYKTMLERLDPKLTKGRLWVRIVQKANGGYQVTRQVRGKEWISDVPKRVAEYLHLEEPEKYTGHTFRRTCAQWAVNSGMTETQMQHHFGWKSATMVTKYSKYSTHLKETAAMNLDLESAKRKEGSSSMMAEERRSRIASSEMDQIDSTVEQRRQHKNVGKEPEEPNPVFFFLII
jgi:hypothetical protein